MINKFHGNRVTHRFSDGNYRPGSIALVRDESRSARDSLLGRPEIPRAIQSMSVLTSKEVAARRMCIQIDMPSIVAGTTVARREDILVRALGRGINYTRPRYEFINYP